MCSRFYWQDGGEAGRRSKNTRQGVKRGSKGMGTGAEAGEVWSPALVF